MSWNLTIRSRWWRTNKMTRFSQICEGTVHFEGQKEVIFRFQSCETMCSQPCPPPTIAYRQNGVGGTLDLRWSCIKNVLWSILLSLIFLQMSHSQSNSRSNCILTHYIRNCVCTNVLIILWDVQKKLRIMIQSFLEISRKVEEYFCHGKN